MVICLFGIKVFIISKNFVLKVSTIWSGVKLLNILVQSIYEKDERIMLISALLYSHICLTYGGGEGTFKLILP